MDWSEKNLCIKCNKADNLLICSENGCPLAMHEACMGCRARFDDAGDFYCPYCLYKKAVAELRQAREYALERKKALSLFMDINVGANERRLQENKGDEANGHHQLKVSEPNVNNDVCNDEGHKSNNLGEEEEKIEEEDSEGSERSSGQEPSINSRDEQNIRNEDGKTANEEEHEDPSVEIHEDKTRNSEEENIHEERCETSSDSTSNDSSQSLRERTKRKLRFKRSKTKIRETRAVSVQSKRVKMVENDKQRSPASTSSMRSSRMSSSSAPRTERVDHASRGSKKGRHSSVQIANETFSGKKRRRLFWSVEEVEKLKEGIEKYSTEINKNIPWRKILMYGHGVFDETRTPGDLREKGRKLFTK
ncbi:hypothetical protein ABFS82_13G052700 [Erythranthe guttata]|uniref:Myb-like domain-containing protein n=1 Tax=Erythranthe guttata TaxID=4155 RepID=A0A022R691_ERYGU|nr:PREDICTED: nuclear localization sequence-binding protein-like [Erythranthe guttata]EYU34385.1 hypothetical protein MIMGU_mgv1a008782mg [Erythranthe guttata]|eukprot:XP_012841008.1 PREDICTED: nuclear localization sequence-binding protein-like [Erythranthe guttata]